MGPDPEPLVSVVVPTYDRPEFLRDAVESVIGQTYGRIELIVVDDCSPTPARESLADVPFDPIESARIVRHGTNRGANTARNTGIGEADGDFVAFLDDDDRWQPAKIERQVERFREAGRETGVVYTGIQYVGPDGTERTSRVSSTSGDVTRDILAGKPLAEFSAVAVRAETIDRAGLPDERFPSWQDREWYLRLSRHCRFEPVAEPLVVRRMGHDGQISDNFEQKRDVSYPLFLEKHRSLAAEYGWLCERQFVAALSEMLGRSALKTGHYADARKYLLRAALQYPFDPSRLAYLLATSGGKYTYRTAQRLVRLAPLA